MTIFRCGAFDVEYIVLADTPEQALEKLKAEPRLAALIKEYQDEGEEINPKDFWANRLETLTPEIAHLG